jgi:hypothetical protein
MSQTQKMRESLAGSAAAVVLAGALSTWGLFSQPVEIYRVVREHAPVNARSS